MSHFAPVLLRKLGVAVLHLPARLFCLGKTFNTKLFGESVFLNNKTLLWLLCLLWAGLAAAHGVEGGDAAFIQNTDGPELLPFMYLGAKHMLTGYDHLLFLFGVIFFLYRLKDVGLYVTFFALGHSSTLLFGVLSRIHVNPFLVDAIIGLSVVYKALDNLGAFKTVLGVQPNPKAAVLIFGLFHGFGLATKLQDFNLSSNGLVPNMLAFNVGVEIGQLLALSAILIAMGFWRRTSSFARHAFISNVVLMGAGFLLTGYQIAGYLFSTSAVAAN